jgi:hypothetical protein
VFPKRWTTGSISGSSPTYVDADLDHGCSTLADAISPSENCGSEGGQPIRWALVLDLGDMSVGQKSSEDEEGKGIVTQFLDTPGSAPQDPAESFLKGLPQSRTQTDSSSRRTKESLIGSLTN